MRKSLVIAIVIMFVARLTAQQSLTETDQLIADIFEQYTAESGDEIDYETFYNELISLTEQPVNLNKAQREQLEKLLFLNDLQIENILYHIYKFGPLNTIYELQLIDGLDMTDIRRMLPFIILETMEKKPAAINRHDLIKYGKNDILFRLDFSAPVKEGYLAVSDEYPDSIPYEGPAFYNSLKYKYHFKDRVYAGITFEKDAGEAFFSGSNSTYDFVSAHFQLNNSGIFKTIVLGDYRASFGQGLVFGNAFGSGKSSLVTNINTRGTGLKKYSSTNEYSFFRGGGATIKLKNTEISAFFSGRKLDAEVSDGIVSSITKTGIHRTENDLLKERKTAQSTIGFNAEYIHTDFRTGVSFAHTNLEHSLQPNPELYNQFYFRGETQTATSIYYRTRFDKFHISGELALNQELALATTHNVSFMPHSLVNMVLLYRYYSPAYDTFFASSFSENTRVNNETGYYTGIEIRPYRKWRISAYADSYRFPYARYNVSSPSWGRDYLLQLDYQHNRSLNMFLRGKFEEKPRDYLAENTASPISLPQQDGMIRYQLNFTNGKITVRTMLEMQFYKGIEKTYGFAALQDVTYAFEKIPLKFDLRYMMFDAADYENRFYTYEKDVLYAFSIPSFYGQGSRFYCNMRYELSDNFSLWFKFSQTIYADGRETIGTGLEMSKGNRRSDFRVMLKWNF